jgi:FdhE protein
LDKLKERIQQIKKKRPIYQELLDFYQKVREEQEKIKASLKIKSILVKKEWKDLLKKEGFPLLQKQDFPLDIEASIHLFQSLCRIAKDANPYMSEKVGKIEETLTREELNLKELFREALKDKNLEQIIEKLGCDKNVFLFLIQNSTKPSIEAGMKHVSEELESETWLKGFCPVCGSLPYLSLLGGEVGKRSLLCSFCGYQWPIERLFCPFCNNNEQESLHYLYAEGEESYRIDVCEKCRHYIKTFDLRKMEVPDPSLEDLATLHLDLLASKRDYQRPVPNPWTP